MSTTTKSHHYVPEWYQRRFIVPGGHPHKLHYLDLAPEKIVHPNGGFHFRTARRLLGPGSCFATDHFYRLSIGGQMTDGLETRFFGAIDYAGARAVDLFTDYELSDDAIQNFSPFLSYIDAQKWRTPKGLDYLKMLTQSDRRYASMTRQQRHQLALLLLQRFHQLHGTIWSESIWEVLCCDHTQSKFIVSDHPVTTYNKGVFPGSPLGRYPADARIELLGTHTLFPLSHSRCLVITNLGYVRNPSVSPTKARENPRYFEQTMFDMRHIQAGRQIDERYVLAINYVLKTRARRYIAAAYEDWLYPERKLETRMWSKLGGRFFLMPDPRKVSFTTGIAAGFEGGGKWSADEYGRSMRREKDMDVKRLREREWVAFQKAKSSWDSAFGKLSREELQKALRGW